MTENLIKVVALPVIEERLRSMKSEIDKKVEEALALICTEETVQTVKAERARLNKLCAELESQRGAVKSAIMGPYNAFEAVYKECVTDALKAADIALKGKIDDVEKEQKQRCEEGLRDYFEELCAVYYLDWLQYEQAGIKVDMASAKAKTPKKLREQLSAFVAGVAESVDRINSLDNAEEIMVEFQQTLDPVGAICTVKERHLRIKQERADREARYAALEQEQEAVRRVEALAPPVVVEAPPVAAEKPEPILKCTFTVRATKPQLRKLKEFLNTEGIKYE